MSPIRENNFEDEWRKALTDAEADPSPIVWDNIEKGLGKGTPWWKKALLPTLVLLFMASGAALYFYTPSSGQLSGSKTSSQTTQAVPDSLGASSAIGGAKRDATPLPQNSTDRSKLEQAGWSSTSDIRKPQASSKREPLQTSPKPELALSDTKVPEENKLQGPVIATPIPGKNPNIPKTEKKTIPSKQAEAVAPPGIVALNKSENPQNPRSASEELRSNNFKKPSPRLQHLATYPAQASYTPLNILSKSRPESIPLNLPDTRPKTWIQFGVMSLWSNSSLQADYQSYLGNYLDAHNLAQIDSENFFESLDEQNESPQTFGFKLEIGREITKRLILKTGLQYMQQVSRIKTNSSFISPENQTTHSFWEEIQANNMADPTFANLVRNQPGFDPNQSSSIYLDQFNGDGRLQLESQSQFLSIPVQLGYQLNPRGRFQYVLLAGLSADIFLQNRTKNLSTGTELLSRANNSVFRSVNWAANFGLEMHYRLNSQLSIYVEPHYRHALRSYTRSTSFFNNPSQSLGLSLGTRFSF